MITKNKLKNLVGLLLAIAMTAGCSSSNAPSSSQLPSVPDSSQTATAPEPASQPEPETETQIESLTIAMTADDATMTPFTYISSPGFEIMRLTYDSLFAISAENTVIPWMIEDSYTVSDDAKVYTMTLLDGQKWHDGTPLTADDVVFTFEYFKNDQTHSRWTPIATKVESIVANGNEITLTLTDPDPGYIRAGLADIRIVSRKAYEGAADPNLVGNMGSGAYRHVEYVPGQSYTLEAVDGYFRGTPKVKTLRMPIITDTTIVQQALISGEIAAFTGSISPELIETYKASPSIKIAQSDGYSSFLLLMDNTSEPFDNISFRKAISRAVNVNALVDMVFLGYAKAGTAGYVRDGLDEFVPGLDHIYNVAEANSLLDSIGYTQKDAAGMRLGLDGNDMTLELMTASNNPQRVRIAELVAQQLAQVGIKTTINAMDSNALVQVVRPEFDTSKPRKYQMAIFGWSPPVVQKPGAIIAKGYSDYVNAGAMNICHYYNEEFDTLAEKFLVSSDMQERADLNAQMQRIVADEAPFVTLLFGDIICAVNADMYDGWVFMKGTHAVNLYSFL